MKNRSTALFITAIVLATYNVMVFAIGGASAHEAAFWLGYAFMMGAMLIVSGTVLALGQRGMRVRDWLFGLPIFKYCVLYIVVELIASAVFMITERDIGWVIPLVVQTLILAVFLVFLSLCMVSKKTITETHRRVVKKTAFIGALRSDAEDLCGRCEDAEAKKVFAAFSEAVRFSDPMSNEALASLESDIVATVAHAGKLLDAGDLAGAVAACEKASLLLNERNRATKVMKAQS